MTEHQLTAPITKHSAGAARGISRERTRPDLNRKLLPLLVVVVVCDGLALGVAAAGTLAWTAGGEEVAVWSDSIALIPWAMLAWFTCLATRGAYTRRDFGGGTEEFRRVTRASLFAFALVGTAAFLLHNHVSRLGLWLFFGSGTVLLLVMRYAVRKVIHRLRDRGLLQIRVVAVGAAGALPDVVAAFERVSYTGYSIVGVCRSESEGEAGRIRPDSVRGVRELGTVDGIVAACEAVEADMVLALPGLESSDTLRKLGWALEGTSIGLAVVPSLLDVAGPRIHMRRVEGLALVYVDEPQFGRAGGRFKRTFDIVVGTALIALASPVMLAAAAVVKLYDGGPVLYRQERSGRNGEHFSMLKFRSMSEDADERRAELIDSMAEDGQVLFKLRDDPRVTPVGRFLRRYSIDELPQLFNVIRGEMSLVGPRPPLPEEVECYPEEMHRRLLVRPGLTGLWQVSGRSDLPFEEAVRMDLYYVDNWSMTTDMVLLLKTARAVLTPQGAY
ncbi:sugar transferase [Nocardioides sp. NPDC057772]|uniref:sugar transferase n=1 Tax=Nocardioides sp. NPDC057772 TaxID=3346245 RepID=UPI00366B414A